MAVLPNKAGFRFISDWMPHCRCWMAWPCQSDDWPDNSLGHARVTYAQVARSIARFEPVTLIYHPDDVIDPSLVCDPNIEILALTIKHSWIRDIGPSFLVNDHNIISGVCWQFNGWGTEEAAQSSVARFILDHLGMTIYTSPLVLEGGAIHSDGQGTLLTTEECLLNVNRNPTLSRDAIETLLYEYTGTKQIIWLGQGYEDDDTNGHIDAVACFVRPGVVLALDTDDSSDGNYKRFKDNLARLKRARDASGRPLEIITVKQPDACYYNKRRLTLSYINYYVANDAIIMPRFMDPMDHEAYQLFRRLYPHSMIVSVPVKNIVPGGGGIHCITLAQPRG